MDKVIVSFLIALILIIIITGYFLYNDKENLTFNLLDTRKSLFETRLYAKLPLSDNIFLEMSNSVDFLPIRNWGVKQIQLESRAALSLLISNPEKILFQNNISEELPIASLTKLITALIVMENYNLDDLIQISREAIMTEGNGPDFVIGEKISVKNLLYAMLMQSSNDSAVALSEKIGKENFVDLINKKIRDLELKNTYFSEPTGLDYKNISSAYDLAKITEYILSSKDFSLIWEILLTPAIDIYSSDGTISHHLINTNKLLEKIPGLIGGKTGYIEEAGDCMVLVMETPNKEKVINIILGAKNKFQEMEKLINWSNSAYLWK